MAEQRGAHDISLKLQGSIDIALEYLRLAINSILFHRNVYPSEDFYLEKRFGLDLLLTINADVERYINRVLKQVKLWLEKGEISHVVLVIVAQEGGAVLERWSFDTHLVELGSEVPLKSEQQMDSEMAAVIKPILSCDGFLPTIEEPTVFNILAYAREDEEADPVPPPPGWEDTHAYGIEEGKSEEVRLKTLDTKLHKVGIAVSYLDS
ncbi:hypothetical protein BOTBODRAFT_140664 [Botryobasidium botryosum FD-172 SS1]|uniref:HORMA domain-containing protein n=1 Tax=Botryobasidium botryosum (strain FD-172 SS1) TaxID=930990 RepID=A0A067M4X7_BOTB1|nr:hypothetical protein BOTBODRAFT_140664 [Botryobasidium botryosum FD-172 SS1]